MRQLTPCREAYLGAHLALHARMHNKTLPSSRPPSRIDETLYSPGNALLAVLTCVERRNVSSETCCKAQRSNTCRQASIVSTNVNLVTVFSPLCTRCPGRAECIWLMSISAGQETQGLLLSASFRQAWALEYASKYESTAISLTSVGRKNAGLLLSLNEKLGLSLRLSSVTSHASRRCRPTMLQHL